MQIKFRGKSPVPPLPPVKEHWNMNIIRNKELLICYLAMQDTECLHFEMFQIQREEERECNEQYHK